MCGIGGAFHYRDGSYQSDRESLFRVRDAMASRGPDATGFWQSDTNSVCFVHRRLSIIDLSPKGAQPMVLGDEALCITFNGEIYNYRELRKELQDKGRRFRSGSDTEVILQMYAEYGPEMLAKLRGMFAFAIWDDKRKGLFLARDHLGIKPLYYSDDGKVLRFASQVKALLAGGNIDTSPEPAGHVGFFLWGYVPEPYTCYKGIRALEAGTSLWIGESGKKTFDRYFSVTSSFKSAVADTLDDSAFTERIRAALMDSVRSHLIADVPVGLFLSAGVDSVALAALACDLGVTHLNTITAVFDAFDGTRNDETINAKKAATHFGFAHQALRIHLDDSALEIELDRLLTAMDQPSIDGVNTYFVAKAAADCGMKVALSGLGGDELFGGYPLFRHIPRVVSALRPVGRLPGAGAAFRWVSSRLFKRLLKPRYQGLLEYGTSEAKAYLLMRGLFFPWELPEILEPDLAREGWRQLNAVGLLEIVADDIDTMHGKITALEMSMYMRNQLLMTSDWAGMAHSVEIRVPFVDVQLFRALAPLLLSSRPPGKAFLAKAANVEGLVPSSSKAKVGFNVPIKDFMAKAYGVPAVRRSNEYRDWAKLVYRSATIGK